MDITEKLKLITDFFMQNKLIFLIGLVYIAWLIKEYSKVRMKLKTLNIELQEAHDEEIKEISHVRQNVAGRGLSIKSSPYIQGMNLIGKKFKQKKEKISHKIAYYKILLFIAWIPFISGLVSSKGKD